MELYLGDCLEVMKQIEDKSIDMICCDLPYAKTSLKWDSIIPLTPLWEEYRRIISDKGAIVLFASEPFATLLRSNALDLYRYDWIWNKTHCSNFQVMNYQPGKQHELICVFSKAKCCYTRNNNSMNYYPQKVIRDKPIRNGGGLNTCKMLHTKSRIHPTQKPVALLEYLIKTYTNEGETVLDNCMGSGTTGVAAINTNRKFIGIEKEENYFKIAQKRLCGEI